MLWFVFVDLLTVAYLLCLRFHILFTIDCCVGICLFVGFCWFVFVFAGYLCSVDLRYLLVLQLMICCGCFGFVTSGLLT